ncbi:hypothetical protein PUF88_06340 [Lactobacillaceae bacterium L1_55_11]|nr:hypothetical protein [Lactobacillaceae bacterium L1_55_11]
MGYEFLIGLIVVEVILFFWASRRPEGKQSFPIFIGLTLFLNFVYLARLGKLSMDGLADVELGFAKVTLVFLVAYLFWRRSRQSKTDLSEFFWAILAITALIIALVLIWA